MRSASSSAEGRLSPTATITESSARRRRTRNARSGRRPRELADPMSTSTVTGPRLVFCSRWARTRHVGEQNRAGRPVVFDGTGSTQPGAAEVAEPRVPFRNESSALSPSGEGVVLLADSRRSRFWCPRARRLSFWTAHRLAFELNAMEPLEDAFHEGVGHGRVPERPCLGVLI